MSQTLAESHPARVDVPTDSAFVRFIDVQKSYDGVDLVVKG